MNEINKTQYFKVPEEVQPVVKDVIDSVQAFYMLGAETR